MRARGFTLLELILVIVITGILAVVMAPIIQEPVRAYFDQVTRAELVDNAEMALRRMARDVRRSLPYSLRTGAGKSVEFVRVLDVARYREHGGPPAQRLSFNNTDSSFNVLGQFQEYGTGVLSGDQRLVIFNLTPGTAGFDVYSGDPVVTSAGTAVTINVDGDEHNVTMAPAFQFQASSPSHRVYIVDGAISYACSGGGLYRQDNYGYLASQPSAAAVAGGGVLMTNNVVDADCLFEYDPGNANRPGLLMMTLRLSSGGESVTLFHQVYVPNAT